jgi:hypothetical protein
MQTLRAFYAQARAEGTTNGLLDGIVGFEDRNLILDLAGIQNLDRQFSGKTPAE